MIRDIRYFVFRVLSSETEEITSDVSNVLHHVNQFTEVRFHEQFNVDLSENPEAMRLNDDEQWMSVRNPRHPHQVDSELLSFDGECQEPACGVTLTKSTGSCLVSTVSDKNPRHPHQVD